MKLNLVIGEIFTRLSQFREESDQQSFNQAMEALLPSINRYISIRLNHGLMNKTIPSGKYKVEDFVDELYILAYDHFHEVETGEGLYSWLFKKADELLSDTEIEEEFDNFFFKNIDNYSKVEWEEMEEKYSIDGDGDFVMLEELDDLSYPKNDYVLEDVFIDDVEKQIIEKLNKELKEEQVNSHINFVLHYLPVVERTVFDLAVIQAFKTEEIAKIKQISVEQVEEYLSNAKNSIRVSFKARYSF